MAETAPGDVMAEIERLRERVRQLEAALKRHTQWFTNKGTRYCGGCLDEVPCPDARLLAEVPHP